jgi:hypothetical protein
MVFDNKLVHIAYSSDCQGYRRVLGHVTAECHEDVVAYFAEDAGYDVHVEPILITKIPEGCAARKNELLRERAELQKKLKEVEDKLKNK